VAAAPSQEVCVVLEIDGRNHASQTIRSCG